MCVTPATGHPCPRRRDLGTARRREGKTRVGVGTSRVGIRGSHEDVAVTTRQLLGVWLVGVVAATSGVGVRTVAPLSDTAATLLGLLCTLGLATVGNHVVGTLFPSPFSFTEDRTPRLLWALGVAAAGTAGWTFAAALDRVARLGLGEHVALWLPLNGVPFVLAAGTLLRIWHVAAVALSITLSLALTGVRTAQVQVLEDEATARLAASGTDRSLVLTVEVPGYRRVSTSGDESSFTQYFAPPATPLSGAEALAEIQVRTAPLAPTGSDTGQETGCCAADGSPEHTSCTVEEDDGLWYRRTDDRHEYLARRDGVEVRVSGGTAVDRRLLRTVARSARPATTEELLELLPPVPHRRAPWESDVLRALLHLPG